MSESDLTPYQDECLTILAEECSETIQEICKIKRFGINANSHHSEGKTHLECLIQEMGDLQAMLQMVQYSLDISNGELEYAKEKKLSKVVKWMTHKRDD